jgi:VWFA-related protein
MIKHSFYTPLVWIVVLAIGVLTAPAQKPNERDKQKVRTVTIPISIFTKKEIETSQASEFVQADRLIVKEDKDEQTILSIRSVSETPLALLVMIQDDLSPGINLQIQDIAKFIRAQPKGTRVMVAYIHGGNVETRQKFTDDLEKAAKSLRIVSSSSTPTGNGPYTGISDVLGRFDGLPAGRRAILLVSDGYDSAQGGRGSAQSPPPELDRAIARSQKRSVAVYSFYSPTALTERADPFVTLVAQGALQRLSEETGGRAFSQGRSAPVSFQPFLKELSVLIKRQFALTYLSTHMKKGYYKVDVASTNPEVKVEHPKGYFYR